MSSLIFIYIFICSLFNNAVSNSGKCHGLFKYYSCFCLEILRKSRKRQNGRSLGRVLNQGSSEYEDGVLTTLPRRLVADIKKYIFLLTTLLLAQTIYCRMIEWLTNNELERTWKEAVVAKFKALKRHSSRRTEENH
jgi:hypothetical protein